MMTTSSRESTYQSEGRTSGSLWRRVFDWASIAQVDEEERAVGARVQLYLRSLVLVVGVFYFGSLAALLLFAPARWVDTMTAPARLAQLVSLLVLVVGLVFVRRTPKHAATTEVLATLLFCGASVWSSANAPAAARPDLLSVLAVTVTLAFRAALVPSTTSRTLATGIACVIPVAGVGLHTYQQVQLAGLPAQPLRLVTLGAWLAAAVFVSTVTTRVIYGLQTLIRRAQRLGQYELHDKLGEGGMGVVYRATHVLLKRMTAIKLIHQQSASSLRRFEREVKLTSTLLHPNTVSVYDYGRTPDGIFYYAMEYVNGVTLKELVSRCGPLPSARVVHLLAQVAGSLAEAHGLGLVHRDIKADNIMLCHRAGVPDHVKVLDFGLVKDTTDDEHASLTAINTIVGTPHYMAPEALTHPEHVDARVDIYALGVLGCYLLTGQMPLDGRNVIEVCSEHLNGKPTPPSTVVEVAPELERVLLLCLAKDAGKRPQSATELRDLLLNVPVACDWHEQAARDWWLNEGGSLLAQRVQPSAVSRSAALSVLIDE